MSEQDVLARGFEANRSHLRAVAYRMLGSTTEAEDAVQEAWLRCSRAGVEGVENVAAWLTTITARVCLDMLRSRKSRREQPLVGADTVTAAGSVDPAEAVVIADSIGLALLVVLETLTPAERVAFVLHDLFDLPFEEIAPIVGRTPAAARQLASRARRRVRGADAPPGDTQRKQKIVAAFLAAARGGDFEALLALLDPDVVAHTGGAAAAIGAPDSVSGAREVAQIFAGRARAAQLALIDGRPGLVWAKRGVPQALFEFTIEEDRIVAIDLVADPERVSLASIRVVRTRRS
jgi:RNA polymerase sigma-70 factor (ECF subfamily)